jgi:hypothetical protein
MDTMNVFAFLVAFALFICGLFLFGYAFDVPSWEAVMFLGGIACISISVAIPFHVLGHGEQR